jgi:hypothetical protein
MAGTDSSTSPEHRFTGNEADASLPRNLSTNPDFRNHGLPAISPGRIGERPLLLCVGDRPEQKPRVRGCSGGFRVAGLWGDDRFLASFRPRVVSSSLALTWVATGQRAAYITDGAVRESAHFSARVAICQAAGPTITDLRGQPWGTTTHGAIVAADAQTH